MEVKARKEPVETVRDRAEEVLGEVAGGRRWREKSLRAMGLKDNWKWMRDRSGLKVIEFRLGEVRWWIPMLT